MTWIFFFPTPPYPPETEGKMTFIQPRWPLVQRSPNPLSLRGWTRSCLGGVPSRLSHIRGLAPSLARPLQGSDEQLVALLCRNRRHPGSLRRCVDHEPVAAVSKFKAQLQQTKGKKKKPTPTRNFRRSSPLGARFGPPTSGPRTRFFRFPEVRLRNQWRGLRTAPARDRGVA